MRGLLIMDKISTGLNNLDRILEGGLIKNRVYLVKGGPGSGKTTLGLQFLLEGVRNNEQTLYITLAEKWGEIKENALNFNNWNKGIIEKIKILDLTPKADEFLEGESYDIFSPSEVEKEPVLTSIANKIEKHSPERLVVDSLTQLKMLYGEQFDYRKQLMSLVSFLNSKDITAYLLTEQLQSSSDIDAPFLTHGIFNLSRKTDNKNVAKKYLQVSKFRGSAYMSGKHEFEICNKGIKIFPRVECHNQDKKENLDLLSSGVPEIDEMLKGGINKETVSIITGQSGVGKTTLGFTFVNNALSSHMKSHVYMFNESVKVLERKLNGLNMSFGKTLKDDNFEITEVNPIKTSANQFLNMVYEDVRQKDVELVLIDSLNTFLLSIDEEGNNENYIIYNLVNFLNDEGVTTILTHEISKITGDFSLTTHGTSYIVDTIIFMRYLEIQGELQRAIGIFKKRLGDHEDKLRKFDITDYGLKVGEPLENVRGILEGSPEFIENDKGEKV